MENDELPVETKIEAAIVLGSLAKGPVTVVQELVDAKIIPILLKGKVWSWIVKEPRRCWLQFSISFSAGLCQKVGRGTSVRVRCVACMNTIFSDYKMQFCAWTCRYAFYRKGWFMYQYDLLQNVEPRLKHISEKWIIRKDIKMYSYGWGWLINWSIVRLNIILCCY